MLPYSVFYCYMIMTHLKRPKIIFFVLLWTPLLLLFSCATRIDGVIREGGAAELSIGSSLKPRTIAVVSSLRDFMGETTGGPILDGSAIAQSIVNAPGVLAVSLVNTSPTALDGNISISNVGDFLVAGDAEGRFITFTEGQAPGTSSIVINLDRYSAPQLISRLSSELAGYLSALMAPVILGERMTRQQYINLVAMIYGRALADEISAARIQASVEFPRPLTAIRGGTAAGNRAEFDVPLLDLLVMEHPLRYEISW